MTRNHLILAALALTISATTLAHGPSRLEFVANHGQWNPNVKYRVAMHNGAVFMENGRITYAFADPVEWQKTHEYNQWTEAQKQAFSVPAHAWRATFAGSNPVSPVGEQVQPHYYNYFLGNDPSAWAGHVPVCHAVKYPGLYSSIDLRAYSGAGRFKYDFIVKPGGDPGDIAISYEGQDDLLLIDGKIVVRTTIGDFVENSPFAYQMTAGGLSEVPCEYVLNGNVVSFHFPDGYNENLDLIIDPELIAATLSGSTATNYGHSATFDLEGNIYTGCISFGVGYPTTDGAFQENFGGGGTDWGISKLSPDGSTLIWASYVGGNASENPHSMIANNMQELYVYGSTQSANFPTVAGSFDTSHNGGADIAIVKFSADGSELIGSTFVGGSDSDGNNAAPVNYGDTYRGEIVLDLDQKPLVVSFTKSTNFPTSNSAYQTAISSNTFQDVVVFRMSINLTTLEASTYIGSEHHDTGYAIREATNGNIYIAGMAAAADFPVTPGAYQTTFLGDENPGWLEIEMDAFVACLNHNLSDVIYATFLATDSQDQIFFLDLDNDENVYVYGQGGTEMPIVGNVFSNPNSRQFITKFDPELSEIIVSTQIGSGAGNDQFAGFDFVPVAFLVDHCNNVYISSYNAWGELDLASPLYTDGGFYLAVLTENLEELEFATKYSENHVDGGTSRFDKNGTVYQGVCSGGNFTTTADAWATNQPAGWDIGVFKIDFDVSGVNSAISGSNIVGCAPFTVDFSNYSTGDTFFWDFGDGTTSTEYEPSHLYEEPGVYEVSLVATDSLSCNVADTSFFEIAISVPVDYFPDYSYEVDCATQSVVCTNTTGYDFLSFVWDMGDGTILETTDAQHTYLEPGTYTITLTAIDEGCQSDSTVTSEITIFNEVVAIIGNDDLAGCLPYAVDFENNSGGITFTWDFGDGSPLQTGQNVSHTYEQAGEFTVTLYAEGNDECPGADTAYSEVVVVAPVPIQSLFDVVQTGACELLNFTADNQSTGENLSYEWSLDGVPLATTEDFSGEADQPGTYQITLTISEEACGQTDEYTQDVTLIDQIDLQLQPDMPLCYYQEEITLQAAEPGSGATYLWSTGETTSFIDVSEPGEYTVEVNWNNCSGTDVVNVQLIPAMVLTEDVNFCEGSTTYLTVPFDGSAYYSWCNGETGQSITTDQDGQYCYQFIDEDGCIQEGIINVFVQDFNASVYIPNAFTPNNDGINDVFSAKGVDISEFELKVWNRWGDEIFSSTDINQVWTGNVDNTGTYYVQDGVYTYTVSYRGICSSEKIEEVGTIVVIR